MKLNYIRKLVYKLIQMADEGQQQECKGANTTRKSWLNWLGKDGVKLAISQENRPVISPKKLCKGNQRIGTSKGL